VTRIGLSRLLVLLLILLFWANGLNHLDRFPPIHEDEPWIAAPGYTFWEKGYFGTDLFAGFYGMEQHYYTFPPLFSLLVGGGQHLFGMGLFQARLIPLICIMLTLAITYRLGASCFSHWHGGVAVAVLVGWRVAGPLSPHFSGIPLADIARIARYDAAVPLFGLAALGLGITALRHPTRRKWFGVGVLAALAFLCHLYGGFWLAVLLLAMLLRFRQRALPLILVTLLGFALTLLPWLLFITSNWQDFLAQNRNLAGRFNLLSMTFYETNLFSEGARYQPLLDTAQYFWGARLWLALMALGLIGLTLRARRGHKPSQTLLVVLGGLVSLFALFSPVKTFSYLATLWPLFALVVAVGCVMLWQFNPITRRFAYKLSYCLGKFSPKSISSGLSVSYGVQQGWKLIVILLLMLPLVEGRVSLRRVRNLAAQITPYQIYTDAIARSLPPDSRVLGLHHYWFGLAEHTASYRSLLVPINWTNSAYVEKPIPFGEAVDMIPSDILLIDQHMLYLLREAAVPDSSLYPLIVQFDRYLREHDAQLIGNIYDPTYGQTLIYQLTPP
jgi:hypothetical protein